MNIILASGSPRRKQLLSQVGLEYEVIISDVEEHPTSTVPSEVVEELSYVKAMAVGEGIKDRKGQYLVIGADTVVAYKNQILGKPVDEGQAKTMLAMLRGKEHSVFTGVSLLLYEGGVLIDQTTFYEETKVKMYPYEQQTIDEYVATGEPMDKAGAYGIQGKGAILVEKIQGDYNNVVGLPVARVYQYVKKYLLDRGSFM